jgi:hypothetical protein
MIDDIDIEAAVRELSEAEALARQVRIETEVAIDHVLAVQHVAAEMARFTREARAGDRLYARLLGLYLPAVGGLLDEVPSELVAEARAVLERHAR